MLTIADNDPGVCQSVITSVTRLHWAKTAERIDVLFAVLKTEEAFYYMGIPILSRQERRSLSNHFDHVLFLSARNIKTS